MVAYSFKAKFEKAIADRVKRQTIRPEGKRRHAKAGEMLQLYVGMRTRNCRKIIPDVVCIGAEPIIIDVPERAEAPATYKMPGRPEQPLLLIDDAFAQRDGFRNSREMVEFWIAEHKPGAFHGLLIRWSD